MAELSDLPLKYRLFAKTYRWRRIDPVPVARRSKPLPECRVALVSSAGFVVPGDEPFDMGVKGGDWSFRTIPHDADVQALEEHHRSDAFDHAGLERDRNLGLPLEPLRALADEGVIGPVAPRHVSLMGSITAPGRLVKHSAPAIAERLVEDQVDLALMVPV